LSDSWTSSDANEDAIRQIVKRVPSLEPALDSHIAAFHEIIPHVFMSDVARWAQAVGDDDLASPSLVDLNDVLEALLRAGKDSVRNLIYVSFIEDIDQHARVVASFGPRLTHAWEDYWLAPFGSDAESE
jgi:hypothetical protein